MLFTDKTSTEGAEALFGTLKSKPKSSKKVTKTKVANKIKKELSKETAKPKPVKAIKSKVKKTPAKKASKVKAPKLKVYKVSGSFSLDVDGNAVKKTKLFVPGSIKVKKDVVLLTLVLKRK